MTEDSLRPMSLWEKARVVHRAWRYRLRTEPGCVRFLLGRLKPGQTALDIGSHKGVFAYWMRQRVGPSGRVIAFEPQPELASYVNRMKAAFRLHNLTVVRAALSSTEGTRQLLIPPQRGCATLEASREEGVRISVEVQCLDACLGRLSARPVLFLKCDVEGHELDVFRGGERMLREDRPLLLFECQDYRHPEGQTRRVFRYLQELGYEGYFFAGFRMGPLSEFRLAGHQPAGGPYLADFAMLPRRAA